MGLWCVAIDCIGTYRCFRGRTVDVILWETPNDPRVYVWKRKAVASVGLLIIGIGLIVSKFVSR